MSVALLPPDPAPGDRPGPRAVDPPAPLDAGERALLICLLYYRVFRFPLRPDELFRFSSHRWESPRECAAAVDRLAARGLVRRSEGFVCVGDPAQATERLAGEREAAAIAAKAERRGRFIARFPFVRAVALSGTLSKGVRRAGDDVDFFVLTAPGRVWLCRGLLMLFKKVFLLDSHEMFCINYLVAEDALEIPDRNLFTATEIAWLRPVAGGELLDAFVRANGWSRDWLPNWTPAEAAVPAAGPSLPARGLEALLSGWAGSRLDEVVRAVIARRNRRRWARLDPASFEVAFRAEKSASKHHPGRFQERVLAALGEARRAFEEEHGVSLAPPGER